MAKVLLYSPEINSQPLLAALSGHEVSSAKTKLELTERIVGEGSSICLVIQSREIDAEFGLLLSSLKKSFPILPVCLVTSNPAGALPESYCRIDATLSAGQLAGELKRFVSSIERADRREKPRFDWPLQGRLSFDQKTWAPYDLRALSSSGAFLECAGPCPSTGSSGWLRVMFQDFSLLTGCVVMDPRQASSNLPPGFGVRFTGLDEEAGRLLDRIVRDALVRALLEPDRPPEVPSIGEDELLPDGFEPL